MRKFIAFITLICFLVMGVMSPVAYASDAPWMPQPGTSVSLTPAFVPAQLKGMAIDPKDPFRFDFLIGRGDESLSDEQKQEEYQKLIKYFLAALAVPDTDQWVNLSPYEKDRIVPDNFGLTEMGRDLLAQDYLLKQLSASLTNPDSELGKKFWDGVYAQAYQKFGTTDIPTDVINKVWIVPDNAVVYEKGNTVVILEHHLKVMMDADYVAAKQRAERVGGEVPDPVNPALAERKKLEVRSKTSEDSEKGTVDPSTSNVSLLTSYQSEAQLSDPAQEIVKNVLREVVIPAIEKEVNEGKNFARVRQVASGMLLATWYKIALKETILGKVYADQSKVKGVDQDPANNQKIYDQYVDAFKKGVFNMIKEDVDRYSQEVIPRKYFSGGYLNKDAAMLQRLTGAERLSDAQAVASDGEVVSAALENEVGVKAQVSSIGVKLNVNGYYKEDGWKGLSLHQARIGELLRDLNKSAVLTSGLEGQALIDSLFGEGNEEVALSLAELASLIRSNISYKENSGDPRGPLEYGIQEGKFFKVGKGLYISPTTESFRRHFIFKTDEQGNILSAHEFMIPGEGPLKRTVGAEKRRQVAHDINDKFPGQQYSVSVVVAETVSGQETAARKFYGLLSFDEVEFAVYDYQVDGKRLAHITQGTKQLWAKQLGVASVHDVEMIVAEKATECLLAVRAAGYVGMADLHTENFRAGIIYDAQGVPGLKVQLVADFGAFKKSINTKAIIYPVIALLGSTISSEQGYGHALGQIVSLMFMNSMLDIHDKGAFFFGPLKHYPGVKKVLSLSLSEIVQLYVKARKTVAAASRHDSNVGVYLFDRTRAVIQEMGSSIGSSDKAQNGGIDFAQSNMDFQIKRDGAGVVLPVSEQNLDNIHIEGLVPVILDIKPASMSPMFGQIEVKAAVASGV